MENPAFYHDMRRTESCMAWGQDQFGSYFHQYPYEETIPDFNPSPYTYPPVHLSEEHREFFPQAPKSFEADLQTKFVFTPYDTALLYPHHSSISSSYDNDGASESSHSQIFSVLSPLDDMERSVHGSASISNHSSPRADSFVDPNNLYPDQDLPTPMDVDETQYAAKPNRTPKKPYFAPKAEPKSKNAESDDDSYKSEDEYVDSPSDDEDPSWDPKKKNASHKRKSSIGGKRKSRSSTGSKTTPTKASPNTDSSRPLGGRAYPCCLAPYGCKKTLSSKNEWKRHCITQHVREGFWRCSLCPITSNGSHNDFSRKDLIVMHLKRMHLQRMMEEYKPLSRETYHNVDNINEEELKAASDSMAQKLFYRIRSFPSKKVCTFCPKVFDGAQAWESWLEHIAYHFDKQRKADGCIAHPSGWAHDAEFEEFLVKENIVSKDHAGQWKATPIRSTP